MLQWLASGDIEEVRPDENALISGPAPARFIVSKTDRLFRFKLEDHSLVWPRGKISEEILRKLGNVEASSTLYVRRKDVPDEVLETGSDLSLAELGVEQVYASKQTWKINVQGVVVEFSEPEITVRQAMQEAGFDPEQNWIIVLKTASGRRNVSTDDRIDLREPGIEKLRLTPRDVNNGELAREGGKREFQLLKSDEDGLTRRQLPYDTLVDGARRWLLLKGYKLPAGYNVAETTVAIEIPSSYPSAELDMFYCFPALNLTSGRIIEQTQVVQDIRGIKFQRWSRHRGPTAPWRPMRDSILTHLTLIDTSLVREVEP
ncbi:MAG: hypothetical protein E5V79_00310 [Mesorhizobium sp.]|nr:MAG: hypothetical protein E5V79_00310 [Mesorhizobium sp.]